jgi:antitoxin MazE
MRVRVQKWGNSLALRIPKPFALETALKPGSAVDLSIADGKLIAEPVSRNRFTLTKLLAGVTRKHLHEEVDMGQSTGREAW